MCFFSCNSVAHYVYLKSSELSSASGFPIPYKGTQTWAVLYARPSPSNDLCSKGTASRSLSSTGFFSQELLETAIKSDQEKINKVLKRCCNAKIQQISKADPNEHLGGGANGLKTVYLPIMIGLLMVFLL